MSAGPIAQARAAFSAGVVKSTTDAARVCKRDPERGGYCGRRSAKETTDDWSEVTCSDCRAAAVADGIRIPKAGQRHG